MILWYRVSDSDILTYSDLTANIPYHLTCTLEYNLLFSEISLSPSSTRIVFILRA